MARPEKEVPGEGPVADLARELRRLRDRAGRPSYRKMAENAYCAASVLADAAAGNRCPTWKVVQAYIRACGEDDAAWHALWAKAQAASAVRTRRSHARRSRAAAGTTVSPGIQAHDRRVTPPPDPWQARTPAEYVRQLRALRAWAGKPGHKAIAEAGRASGILASDGNHGWEDLFLPSSTLYDALSVDRTTLPQLRITQMIVHACHADVEAWTAAWQAISLHEFEAQNPALPDAGSSPEPGPSPVRSMRLVS